jgi:PKD repeat protein
MSKGTPCLVALFFLLGYSLFAQDIQWNKCNTVEVTQWMRIQYPQMESDDTFEEWIAPKLSALKMDPRMRSTLTIPIVFHIIHDGTAIGAADNPLDGYIYAQIEQINNDFRKKLGTSGYNNHPSGADIELEFCPATQSPSGILLSSPGINRINRNQFGWIAPPYGTCDGDNFGASYIQTTIKPATQWDPNQYLNVWVLQTSCNVLGYAQFPSTSGLNGIGSNNGIASTDGVVIRPETLGSTDQNNPYSQNFGMGRTLTHELGHFFGLRHIWGDSNCGNDFCDDTPQSYSSNRGCPDITTCDGVKDMVENYMDYTNDACVNIFTQDQKSRMLTVLANSPRRGTLTSSTSCGATNAPLTANFYASITEVDPGQSVQFTNLSSGNPIAFQWTFPGGTPSTSSLPNPLISYTESGLYSVTLAITNSQGAINSVTKNNFVTVRDHTVGSCPNSTPIQNLVESFESTTSPWEQSSQDDFNWTRTNKATPSSGTGPQSASEGSYYLFMEASSPNYPNKTASLNSPCLHSLSITEGYLSFDYHLYSSDVSNTIGSLKLEYSIDQNNWNTLWEQNGSTGQDQWLTASVDLEPIVGQEQLYLRINGKTGTTWRNDIGIDNISFSQTAKSNTKVPKAAFSASPLTLSTGNQVDFVDESKHNPTFWAWTFEGGTPSSSANPNPTITYYNSGIFDVQLIVGNDAGFDTLQKINFITVDAALPEPIAAFTTNNTAIEVGDQIVFEDLSSGNPTSWNWFFEGGSPQSSTAVNPSITYNSTGVFDVSLEVTNAQGSDIEIKQGYITVTNSNANPIPNFTANKRIVNQGDSVIFDDISSGNVTLREWSFEGGTPATSSIVEPVITYNTPGFYDVQLKVYNDTNGDSLTQLEYIQVIENPVSPFIDCDNGIRTFPYFEGFDISNNISWANISSGDDFDWLLNSGNTPSAGTGPPSAANGPFYYFVEASSPNYPFKEAVLQSTCFDFSTFGQLTFSFQYHMLGTHIGTLSLEATTNQTDWETLWSQSGDQGNLWNTAVLDLSNEYASNSNVTFRFKATTTDGWQGDIAIDNIRVFTVDAIGQAPVAEFESTTVLVEVDSSVQFVDLSDYSPSSWEWTFDGGTPATSTSPFPSVTYTASGTYDVTLKVTNAFGEDSTSKVGYITVVENCLDSIITLPYSESFETGFGLWTNIEEDSTYITSGLVDTLVDWQLIDSATFTMGTGPDTALNGIYYLYLETTDSTANNKGELATILSPCIDFSSTDMPIIQFGYHLFGDDANLDSLKLEGSSDGMSWELLWSISDNQNNQWDTAIVRLDTFARNGGTKLRFTAQSHSASGDLGDIAIDDIRIYDQLNQPVVRSFPDSIFFTFGISPWQQATDDDFDWTWTNLATPSSNTGPDTAYYGSHFLYAEASEPNYPQKKATLLSPPYDFTNVEASSSPTLSFANHRQGGNVGSLEVFASTDNINWQSLSSLTGANGTDWTVESINLASSAPSLLGQPLVWFKFVATTGDDWDGDIGLDYIRLDAVPTIQDPIPDFTVSDTVIQVGQSITFTDISTESPNTWEWTFTSGGGVTYPSTVSVASGFTYRFDATDTVSVTLSVSNGSTGSPVDTTKTSLIKIQSNTSEPIANFMVNAQQVLQNQSITFSDVSANNPNQWDWLITNQYSDTITTSTDSVFTHTFIRANDTLNVRLIAANEIGSDTLLRENYLIIDSLYASSCSSPIGIPLSTDFETGNIPNSIWNQSTFDDFDWSVKSGATPSLYTGPIQAKEGSFYAYLEASPPNNPNKLAILESNCFDWQEFNQVELSFAYHMYGRDINSLAVQLRTNPNEQWYTFWETTGNQGNLWRNARLNLSAYAGKNLVFLRFVGKTGDSWQGDIALDQITIEGVSTDSPPVADFEASKTDITTEESVQFTNLSQGATSIVSWIFEGGTPASSVEQNPLITYDTPGVYKVSLEVANNYGQDQKVKNNYIVVSPKGNICNNGPLPFSEGFENGFEHWIQDSEDDFDWEINSGLTNSSGTGPNSAFEGNNYAFIEASSPNYPNKTAILEGLCMDLSYLTTPFVRFSYHMYGSDSGMGKLELQARTPSSEWIPLWADSINRGNQWITINQSLSVLTSFEQTKLRFVATTKDSWQSDIAIDDIEFLDSSTFNAVISSNGFNMNQNMEQIPKIRLEQAVEKSVDLFPNPATETIRVAYQTPESGISEIIIFDLLGNRQLLKTLETFEGANTLDLDLSRLPSGSYILAVLQNGGWTRKRFLKL